MSHDDDFQFDPYPGLPEELPAGERILWQGSPNWRALARRLFKVRQIAVYFGILVAWGVITAFYDGRGAGAAASSAALLGSMALAGIGLLLAYAWLIARTSIYTITTNRLVVRTGAALPLTINLPFKQIHAARLAVHGDGTGDLPLVLRPGNKAAYLHLWPHARPWKFKHTEPMLRCVPEPEKVSDILADALTAAMAKVPTEAVRAAKDPAAATAAPTTARGGSETREPAGAMARAAAAR